MTPMCALSHGKQHRYVLMSYEFDIFDTIIHEQSEPFINNQQDQGNYKELLLQRPEPIFDIIEATFKKNKKGFQLLSRKRICSLHPEIHQYSSIQLSLFNVDISRALDKQAIKDLAIDPGTVLNYAITGSQAKTTICIKLETTAHNFLPAEAKYYYYNLLFKEEILRIKKSIKVKVTTSSSTEDARHYIHNQQQALINISFKISKLLDPRKEQDPYKPAVDFNEQDIISLTHHYVDDLIQFFEINFLQFINQNIEVPYRTALVKLYDIPEKLKIVKERLLQAQIDSELLNIIYKPFLQLSVITYPARITYGELIYSNTFLTTFYTEFVENAKSLGLAQIVDIVYRYNFNSIEMVAYKIENFRKHLIHYSDAEQKIDYLQHCLKVVGQRFCRQNIAYLPDMPSLKQQITTWLQEEITYFSMKPASQNLQSTVTGHESPTKLRSTLSVAQLAYFFRLIAEVGVIDHPNQSDIIRFMVANFQTPNTPEIAFESARGKYYKVDEATEHALKDVIIEMLNKVRR